MVSYASLINGVRAMHSGGIIAYPAESCFGLGCDPSNSFAIRRLLRLKNRKREKGLILIASNIKQLEHWVNLRASPNYAEIIASWPGPHTWILPGSVSLNRWLVGMHCGLAVRVTAHPVAAKLCELFGGPIVSSSANIHGRPALQTAQQVQKCYGSRLQGLVHDRIGNTGFPSEIRDGMSGKIIRPSQR
ncbi:MAG: tRNA threonylcarbamoyladenosine biosynthesis protein RimN [Proteobacteria bacterium]|jgi:L-threonylcarbamoyladenylate synthase|nr:tRNA threonylcarbamoyladenosine biosynthesis protein RimN [Pseudomonadota bacterium]